MPKTGSLKRTIVLVLAITVMIVAAGLIIQRGVATASVDDKLKTAYKYITEGKYEEAIAIYNDILKIDRNNPQVLTDLGVAYSAIGEYDKAKSCFEKAIKADPGRPFAYEELSRLEMIEGNEDKAIEVLDQGLDETSDDSIESEIVKIEERTLVGNVVDADSGKGIGGSEIKLYKANEPQASGTTYSDENGNFNVKAPAGDYKLVVSKEGYYTVETYQKITDDNMTYQAKIRMVKKSDNPEKLEYTVSLLARDAFTGKAITTGRLTAYFIPGIFSDLPPKEQAAAQTGIDSKGKCSINLPAGNYTVLVVSDDNSYNPSSTQVVAGGRDKVEVVSLTPMLKENEMRAVLTWSSATDLDAFVGNSGGTVVYFKNKVYNGNNRISLDTDVTTGYGPETVTIVQNDASEGFIFYVDHFYEGRNSEKDMQDSFLSGSGAKVVLYIGNKEKRVFNVPTNRKGSTWKVFEIVNGEVVVSNTLGTGRMVGYTDDGIIG